MLPIRIARKNLPIFFKPSSGGTIRAVGVVDDDTGLHVIDKDMETDAFSPILDGPGFHYDTAGHQIALGLAEAFDCSVNELPLSIILCWFEQKAVCVLMALLALGIRGIRLGPTLPAFLSPGVAAVLQEKYDLRPITTPEDDLAACLGRH